MGLSFWCTVSLVRGKSYLCVALVIFIREYIVKHYNKLRKKDTVREYPNTNVRIMIAASTNVAVDGLLSSLLKHNFTDFVRVGSTKRIAQDIKKKEHKSTNAITSSVVGITCASVLNKTCMNRNDALPFDILFLDECSQMIEPQSILPITASQCSKMVMVGDPMQLPPVVRSTGSGSGVSSSSSSSGTSDTTGLEQAMFVRLSKSTSPILLRTQYRCHPDICTLSSNLFYEGRLKSGISATERRPLVDLKPLVAYNCTQYGQEVRKAMPPVGSSYINEFEVTIIVQVIANLIVHNGIEPNDIGVIAMFRAQAELIQSKLEQLNIGQLLQTRDEQQAFMQEQEQQERLAAAAAALLEEEEEEDDDDEMMVVSDGEDGSSNSSNSGEKRKRTRTKNNKNKKNKNNPKNNNNVALAGFMKRKKKKKIGKKAFQQRCHIKVSTVDAFQGAEREIILLSTTRTQLNSSTSNKNDMDTNHLTSPHRLCVALTRARRHLILVGHLNNLHRHGGVIWKTIIDQMANLNRIIVTGRNGVVKTAVERQQAPQKPRPTHVQPQPAHTLPPTGALVSQSVAAVDVDVPHDNGDASSVPATTSNDIDVDSFGGDSSSSDDDDDEEDPFSVDDDDDMEDHNNGVGSNKRGGQEPSLVQSSDDEEVEYVKPSSPLLIDSDDEADALFDVDCFGK